MTLSLEVEEELLAKLSDVHRAGETVRVADMIGWLRRSFPRVRLSRPEIERAIIANAALQKIPVEFDKPR